MLSLIHLKSKSHWYKTRTIPCSNNWLLLSPLSQSQLIVQSRTTFKSIKESIFWKMLFTCRLKISFQLTLPNQKARTQSFAKNLFSHEFSRWKKDKKRFTCPTTLNSNISFLKEVLRLVWRMLLLSQHLSIHLHCNLSHWKKFWQHQLFHKFQTRRKNQQISPKKSSRRSRIL